MSPDLAVDLGSATVRVAEPGGDVLVEEPSVAAVEVGEARMVAFGRKALGLAASGGPSGRIQLVRPVRHGQLVDVRLADEVLEHVVRSAGVARLAHPRVLACVHVDVTHVQRDALERGLRRAGARQVRFVEQPIAAAMGAGLPVGEPEGMMAVEVGAGTTDVAVIALGGTVTSVSVPVGSADFDEALRTLLARRFGLVVDRSSAEEVRRRIGSVLPEPSSPHLEVRGRDVSTGAPARVVVSSEQLRPTLEELVAPIVSAAVDCVARTPPDLANDLLERGLSLSGGGSYLRGLEERLAAATGLAVHPAPSRERCAVLGAARCLGGDRLALLVSAARRR